MTAEQHALEEQAAAVLKRGLAKLDAGIPLRTIDTYEERLSAVIAAQQRNEGRGDDSGPPAQA